MGLAFQIRSSSAQFCRFLRFGRLNKSISCVFSISLNIPTPPASTKSYLLCLSIFLILAPRRENTNARGPSFFYGRLQKRARASILPGSLPTSRLNTRLKELSDPYPMADATSENDVFFEPIMAPALYMRHCVRYSRGVWPKTVLNFKAKADLDMLASRASDSTNQLLSMPECIASMALLRCLSEMAANRPFGGAAELLA
jgi:hypothetical protein